MTTDAGLQLDMFKRVRAPRAQRMAYRDRGWNGRGKEICKFECSQCGSERWIECRIEDADEGPECPKCNKGKR